MGKKLIYRSFSLLPKIYKFKMLPIVPTKVNPVRNLFVKLHDIIKVLRLFRQSLASHPSLQLANYRHCM